MTGCTKTKWMVNKVGNMQMFNVLDVLDVLDVQYTKKWVLIFKSVKAKFTN
jgi:hypothetical protein